eukprot:986799_1
MDLARMTKPIIDQKEVRFFDSFWYNQLQTVANHSLLTAWKWYLQVFNQDELAPDAHLLRGEASPTYFASSQVTAERIKLWLPNAKLILLLRNPVRRFVSHLKMIKENHAKQLRHDSPLQYEYGEDKKRKSARGAIYKLSMYQVILVSDANPNGNSRDFYQKRWGITRHVTGFINALLFGGTYTMRMREWLKRFDKDHLFYRESSELFNDPVGLMKDLEAFLEITPFGDEMWSNITTKVYNVQFEKGKGYQHKVQETEGMQHWDIEVEKETQIVRPDESAHWWSQELISMVKDYYRPHNRQLADLFDGNKYKDWDY